ncbi:684_t:CDS:2 [Diversispora eburnea]|uniref:684_t:CDS:1 n=1 Tax=Diversispora eburnea TaxID=1213867 RepID=A0A9N9AYC5_9GLOM|nr:684_t:CDS:2 [Diversispora eburnea]
MKPVLQLIQEKILMDEPPYGTDTTGTARTVIKTSTITDHPVGAINTLAETKQRYVIPEDTIITSNQDAKTSNETNIARVIVISIDRSNCSRMGEVI